MYRLPGPDGACNTADDVFPHGGQNRNVGKQRADRGDRIVAAVHNSTGGITGFVIISGANLVLVDSNFANPTTLGTFGAPINVAVALPVGTTQGYPTGQLYVVDGNIVYVNYTALTTSQPLFTIPNWTTTNAAAIFRGVADFAVLCDQLARSQSNARADQHLFHALERLRRANGDRQ